MIQSVNTQNINKDSVVFVEMEATKEQCLEGANMEMDVKNESTEGS